MNKILLTTIGVALSLVSGIAGAYIRPAIQGLCQSPYYTCVRVPSGGSWHSMFPNEHQREVVMSVNRMNTWLSPGMVIAVPRNLSGIDKMDVAPFSRQIAAPGRKTIIVNLSKYAWGAYSPGGSLVNWGPVSGGKGWCPDIHSHCHTPIGHYAIYAKGGSGCKSKKFPVGKGGAPMPYCMFFKGGFALHGSPIVPGYHASHGCVRLFTEDARWLNQQFIDTGGGTSVIVRGS